MIEAHVSEDGKRIVVSCPPTYTEVMKRIPGALYQKGQWTTPLAWPACLQLRDEFGELLVIGQSLVSWAQSYLERKEAVMAAQRGEIVLPGLDTRLRPQQALGATWLAWAGRCMLLDEMRSGKTPQMLCALTGLGPSAFPALIICPSTTRWVWAGEVDEWTSGTGITPFVLSGTPTQRRKTLAEATDCHANGGYPVVITNWESIRTLSRLAGYGSVNLSDKEKERGPLNEVGFQTVIADEAHRALDPHSKQTRALWFLMHEAKRRYLLTATPVSKSGADLWSLWYAVAPEETPVRTKWMERYTICGQGRFGWEVFGFRPDKETEMFSALEPRMLRRTMREVREGMPPRLPLELRRTPLEGSQAKTYASLKKTMLAELETADGGKGVLVVTDPLTLTGRLQYAAAATPVLDDDGNVVALGMPSVKVDTLLSVLDENPGEPLVVFMTSRKLAELCEEQLDKAKITYVSVHGGVPPELRAANVARFQQGGAQVCLCTTAAGSEGITLNRAWRTLFLQRSWRNNVENLQAEARTDGLVGGPPLETIFHVSTGTIEERTLEGGKIEVGYLQELLRDELRTK